MVWHSLYILDATGQAIPCDHVGIWRQWFDTTDRTLALDILPSGTRVETIFLSLNHAFRPGPPVLWETTVEGGLAPMMVRYTSGMAALNGHEQLVNTIRQGEAALAARSWAAEHTPIAADA